MKPKTLEAVRVIAAVSEPFGVRDLYEAGPQVARATMQKALGVLVQKRWVGPDDGKKRDPHANKKKFKYMRTERFPKTIENSNQFKVKKRPTAPLYEPTSHDVAWRELRASFSAPPMTAADLLPECEEPA